MHKERYIKNAKEKTQRETVHPSSSIFPATERKSFIFFREKGVTSSQTQKETKAQLESRLKKNFYLTFKFSQGDASLHQFLMFETAPLYDLENYQREFGSINELNHHLRQKIAQLRLPNAHGREESVFTEFLKEWDNQMGMFAYLTNESLFLSEGDIPRAKLNELKRIPRQKRLLTIVQSMAERDIHYLDLEEGRPEKVPYGKDPHESHIKTYIIDRKNTNSDGFNALFEDMRGMVVKLLANNARGIDKSYKDDFHQVAKEIRILRMNWESLHSGYTFDR